MKDVKNNYNRNDNLITMKSYCAARYARGSVWWINLPEDPLCPNRQKGERPVLIYSSNLENNRGNFVAVIPMSGSDSNEPYVGTKCVKVNYDGPSYILANQIFMVNSENFKSYYFSVSEEVMEQVENIRMKADGIAHKYIRTNTMANNLNIIKIIENIFTKNNSFVTNPINNTKTDNHIEELNTKVCELTNTLNELTDNLTKVKNENEQLRNINAELSNQCNKAHEKLNNISIVKEPINNKSVTSITRRFNGLPRGFWKDINNNIEFWNNYITKGIEWCMNRYDYNTPKRLEKRKSNVRCMLIHAGYNVRNGVKIRKNDALS